MLSVLLRAIATAALLAALTAPAHAHATFADDPVKAQEQAMLMFTLQVLQARGTDGIATLNNEENLARVRILGDRKRLLDDVTFGSTDFEKLQGRCNHVSMVAKSLIMFEPTPGSGGNPSSPGFQQHLESNVAANMKRFDPHLIVLMPFMARCMEEMMKVTVQFLETLPPEEMTDVRRGGLLQARGGMMQTLEGGLKMVEEPGNGTALKQAMVAVLEEVSRTYASALPLVQRHAVATRIRSLAAAEPTYRDGLERTAAAFDATTCTGLCTY